MFLHRTKHRIKKLALTLVVCLSSAALILAQSKPKTASAPTFVTVFPNYAYPQTVASMLEFDTKNAPLAIFDDSGKPTTTAKLQNGVFDEHQKDGAYTNIRFTDYQYFEYFNEQPNHALAAITWSTAGPSGTTSIGLLQVFEVRDGHPVVTEQIRYNRIGDLTGASFNPTTLALTIKANRWSEHTTVANIEVGKFRWDGKKFVLQPSAARK